MRKIPIIMSMVATTMIFTPTVIFTNAKNMFNTLSLENNYFSKLNQLSGVLPKSYPRYKKANSRKPYLGTTKFQLEYNKNSILQGKSYRKISATDKSCIIRRQSLRPAFIES